MKLINKIFHGRKNMVEILDVNENFDISTRIVGMSCALGAGNCISKGGYVFIEKTVPRFNFDEEVPNVNERKVTSKKGSFLNEFLLKDVELIFIDNEVFKGNGKLITRLNEEGVLEGFEMPFNRNDEELVLNRCLVMIVAKERYTSKALGMKPFMPEFFRLEGVNTGEVTGDYKAVNQWCRIVLFSIYACSYAYNWKGTEFDCRGFNLKIGDVTVDNRDFY